MPIYEYKCTKCDKEFEVLVLGPGEEIRCPQCDTDKVVRLMSGFAHKCEGGPMVSTGGGCSGCTGGDCSSCS